MPTVEQLKLRKEKIEHYCAGIAIHKYEGLEQLDRDIKTKMATASIRIAVLALALARGFIEVGDIPAKLADEVCEKWLKEAGDRERDIAADRGTEVHDLAERLAQGEVVDVPAELAGHIRSWYAFVERWKMRFIATEFTVFHLKYGYAGTGDFLGYSELHPEWGLILGDYKTSVSGIWADICLQLAAIRFAQFIGRCKDKPDFHTDHSQCEFLTDSTTLPKVKTCVGVQITELGFQVVPARAGKAHFNTFLSGLNVAKWKTEGEQLALDKDSFPFEKVA